MDIERELLKGNTPTLILAILRDGPLHGYAIARELERRTQNTLKFKDGTLYPTLHTLEADELVVSRWDNPARGQARKVYEVTEQGLAILEQRRRGWLTFVNAVDKVIGGADHERLAKESA
jgi:DNA-binding PadR family transcriptional regulator